MRATRPARARPARRPLRAFTLIELLVTIGIMIFVLGIVVVGFQAMFRNVGVRSGSRVLRAAVDSARVRAIQQRRHIRFEAQLIPGTTTHQWHVVANAGDTAQEWKELPDFVAVATNAGQGGADGRSGDYRGAVGNAAADETGDVVQRIAVTFGPNGSIRRWVLGGVRQSSGAYPDVTSSGTNPPTGMFSLRLTNMRDAQGGKLPQRWLVIIPLTGGIQPYDAESESF